MGEAVPYKVVNKTGQRIGIVGSTLQDLMIKGLYYLNKLKMSQGDD